MTRPLRIEPDRDRFCELAARGTLVPVWCERLADLDTPVSAFAKVVGERPGFLLESVQGGERWASYSFVGCDPLMTLVGGRGELRVTTAEGVRVLEGDDPVELVGQALAPLGLSTTEETFGRRPRFLAGAVGYLGYDIVRAFERIGDRAPDPLGLPEVSLMVPATVLVFDTLRQVVRVVRNVHLPDGADPAAAWEAARSSLEATVARLESARLPPRIAPAPAGPGAGLEAQTSRADFEAAVRRAREYVLAGDCIQTVLSQRFEGPQTVPAFEVYRALRTTNPSPYMYFLRLDDGAGGDVEVAGASPEVLVRLEEGEVVVRPIAGTRPRGADAAADAALEAQLRSDPKECAEHVMLVDLGRNDVGRVAVGGSVRVEEFMVVERYSHVMHLVSEVRGRPRPGVGAAEVLRSTFPAGTLSGAPKVRAMEIIEELEPFRRGIYGGAVGYLGLDGAMDLCICIRTLVAHGGRMHVQAGAGIVADSDPALEWEETVHKASSVFRAVQLARGGLEL